MLGALIGDYIGSTYERFNTKDYNFELITKYSTFTDDSILTMAIIDATLDYFHLFEQGTHLEDYKKLVIDKMVAYAKKENNRHYFGKMFRNRIDNPVPYGSYGNGAAMRVSGIGLLGRSEEEVKTLTKIVTDVSHNHQDSEKAAECVAMAVYKARKTRDKAQTVKVIETYYPSINQINLDQLRPDYKFDSSCKGSVPIALKAFIDGKSFEDVLRISISMGGDSDTIAAISCSIAAEIYDDSLLFWEKINRLVFDQFKESYSAYRFYTLYNH